MKHSLLQRLVAVASQCPAIHYTDGEHWVQKASAHDCEMIRRPDPYRSRAFPEPDLIGVKLSISHQFEYMYITLA